MPQVVLKASAVLGTLDACTFGIKVVRLSAGHFVLIGSTPALGRGYATFVFCPAIGWLSVKYLDVCILLGALGASMALTSRPRAGTS